jgi:hypothetical protein
MKMLKKSLFALALVAMLACALQAGDVKREGDWWGHWSWDTYTLDTIPVKIHIPYYAKVEQDSEIVMEQVGQDGTERFHFEGYAKLTGGDRKGLKPRIDTNFDATLSVSLTILGPGTSIQSDGAKWYKSVDPTAILGSAGWTELTIVCGVRDANLNAFQRCETITVANVLLKIIPTTP